MALWSPRKVYTFFFYVLRTSTELWWAGRPPLPAGFVGVAVLTLILTDLVLSALCVGCMVLGQTIPKASFTWFFNGTLAATGTFNYFVLVHRRQWLRFKHQFPKLTEDDIAFLGMGITIVCLGVFGATFAYFTSKVFV